MIWKSFVSLFYPDLCNACHENLVAGEQQVCLYCRATLPRTAFHLDEDNPVRRIFSGRLPVMAAASYFFFDQSSRVQEMLHRIKYHGNHQLAKSLGEWYGHELLETQWADTSEILAAVPLHPKKLRTRGFNQSDEFARGLSVSLGISFDPKTLVRKKFTETQTRKSRMQRWENVENVFTVPDPSTVAGKQVILVDDVLTTGATMEACGHALLEAGAASLKILTIACAMKI